ncbi:unnamed protein product [Colias eurytheme]|nr:unnamed protein product [Colias eurytheme]
MRLLHVLFVVLTVLLALSVVDGRPPSRGFRLQKRSWCLLKLCSYPPAPHPQKSLEERRAFLCKQLFGNL